MVRKLLAAGVNPNVADAKGDTPLIKALWRADSLDVVKILLEAGANPELPDGYNHKRLFTTSPEYPE
eukprot:9444960-Pyramimonas_sp.AAC.1